MSSERASIHSSGEKRTAPSLFSSILASVVLPEPGNPHTMISLGPVLDFSIKEIIPDGRSTRAGVFTWERANGFPIDLLPMVLDCRFEIQRSGATIRAVGNCQHGKAQSADRETCQERSG